VGSERVWTRIFRRCSTVSLRATSPMPKTSALRSTIRRIKPPRAWLPGLSAARPRTGIYPDLPRDIRRVSPKLGGYRLRQPVADTGVSISRHRILRCSVFSAGANVFCRAGNICFDGRRWDWNKRLPCDGMRIGSSLGRRAELFCLTLRTFKAFFYSVEVGDSAVAGAVGRGPHLDICVCGPLCAPGAHGLDQGRCDLFAVPPSHES